MSPYHPDPSLASVCVVSSLQLFGNRNFGCGTREILQVVLFRGALVPGCSSCVKNFQQLPEFDEFLISQDLGQRDA
jgi:hypothetical protein